MTKKILFVCLGNICRSPAAEGVARAAGLTNVDSAGTSDWHVGEPPYGPMQEAAIAREIDLSTLRARQFVAEDFARFDLIIAMDGANVERIEEKRPLGNATPVQKLLDYAGTTGDVPDPYYTRDFEGCLDLIEAGVAGLKQRL